MKRLLVGVCVLALVGVGVGSAVGQGAGGTVGAGATGVKTFDIAFKGFGCGKPGPVSKCFTGKPRIGAVVAGNGTASEGGKKVGTVVFSSVIAKRIKGGTMDTFTATIIYSNGKDSITIAGAQRDPGTQFPYAVTGGTGIYAGARGTGRDVKVTENGVTAEVTFIP